MHAENPDDIGVAYFVFNALILAGGIGLNTFGARLRARRRNALREQAEVAGLGRGLGA